MTDSASSFMAVIFGLGVFAVIVAVGWRSVQNRRIVRLMGSDGHETIILAKEDDEISSVITTTEGTAAPPPAVVVVTTGIPDPAAAVEFGRRPTNDATSTDAQVDLAGRDRLSRVVSPTE